MEKIEMTPCGTEGLYIIELPVPDDEWGHFIETYNQNDFKGVSPDMVFVQDNRSMSVKGVLHGLHFQKQYPQGKLICMVRGRVFDVAVDPRSSSKTYEKWFGVGLTTGNKKQFCIPEGFAHGFSVLPDEAKPCYKYTDFYRPGGKGGMAWDDAEIGIEWLIEDGMKLIISEKDQKQQGFKDTFKF